jgi:hypothetical protein
MQALEMSCDDASVLLGDNAYLLVLLITFLLAPLQGASAVAIFQLGVAFIATESITPYEHSVSNSLLIIQDARWSQSRWYAQRWPNAQVAMLTLAPGSCVFLKRTIQFSGKQF